MDAKLQQALRNGTEAEQILARMRAGMVSRDMVELAAYCGSEGARGALEWRSGGNGRVYIPNPTRGRPDWNCEPLSLRILLGGDGTGFGGLTRWGQETMVRASVAAARVALEKQFGCICSVYIYQTNCPAHSSAGRREKWAIQAAEDWILCPCEACFKIWSLAWSDAVQGSQPGWLPVDEENVEVIQQAARLAGEQAVREVIQRELVPWALGTGDPVRERVNGR